MWLQVLSKLVYKQGNCWVDFMDMSMMAATKPANTEKKVLLQPETMIKP